MKRVKHEARIVMRSKRLPMFDCATIAKAEGITTNAVTMRVKRRRRQLRVEYDSETGLNFVDGDAYCDMLAKLRGKTQADAERVREALRLRAHERTVAKLRGEDVIGNYRVVLHENDVKRVILLKHYAIEYY